ncbi:MAG: hypothetical protein Q4G63_08335 [Bacteroidia bacterium]|nr:hypothetical protein [Bacteroidia bacterium]
MTVLEKKAILIKSVLDESVDEVILDELDLFFKSLRRNKTTDYPCQYSVSEVREGIERSVEQVDKGEFLSHNEVKNRYKNPE